MDLLLISSKFPIGVATIYSPFLRLVCKFVLIFIIFSCTPRIVSNEDILTKDNNQPIQKRIKQIVISEETPIINQISEQQKTEQKILNEIEVILPIDGNKIITNNFINSLELSMYKKNISNLSLNINTYSTNNQLQEIIKEKIEPGKIFIGPLTSSDTEKIIDCFITGNIPIYRGAKDIGRFFDERGILTWTTLDELKSILDNLSVNTYKAMLPYVKNNLEIAKNYINPDDKLYDLIKKCVKNKNYDTIEDFIYEGL